MPRGVKWVDVTAEQEREHFRLRKVFDEALKMMFATANMAGIEVRAKVTYPLLRVKAEKEGA